jgi:hypothetical protein
LGKQLGGFNPQPPGNSNTGHNYTGPEKKNEKFTARNALFVQSNPKFISNVLQSVYKTTVILNQQHGIDATFIFWVVRHLSILACNIPDTTMSIFSLKRS